jgi:hypothetical protein
VPERLWFYPATVRVGDQIPGLKGGTWYVVDTEDGYESLYRRLTRQPGVVRPALGMGLVPGKRLLSGIAARLHEQPGVAGDSKSRQSTPSTEDPSANPDHLHDLERIAVEIDQAASLSRGRHP